MVRRVVGAHACGNPLNQPERTIGVPQQQPAGSEVTAPPSNAATTRGCPKPLKSHTSR
jgi:hypothetical protein